MRILTGDQLKTLLPTKALVAAIEQSLYTLSAQPVSVPPRQHITMPGGTALLMPALDAEHLGVKLVTVMPGNTATELPVTSGLMALLDARTGQVGAVLDAAVLTSRRTGAVGALGLKWTTPDSLDSIGVIGTGVQGAWQAISACAVRPIKDIYYLARSASSAQRFRQTVQQHIKDVRLIACSNSRTLLQCTSTVIAATTSAEPALPDEPESLEGKHFVSVGSFRPSMQELPLSAFRRAGHVVIDSAAARHEVGDVINPIRAGILSETDVIHLSELVGGRRTVDVNHTTIFKSVGWALYDLVAAKAFVQAATHLDVGHIIDW